MNLYWNLSLGQLVNGLNSNVPLNSMAFMRRDAAELRVVFFDEGAGVPKEMPAATEIRFALKPYASEGVPDYTADPVVFTAAFSENADFTWSANPSFNTVELDTEFSADPVSIAYAGQLTMRPDSGSSAWSSTQTLEVTVINDLIRGDEGTPTNAGDPTDYLTLVAAEARYPRYDAAQTLDSGEQMQARTNIGAVNQDIQILTGSGDWTNPSPGTPKLMDIIMIGDGGGGGSGRKGSSGSNIGGGGGGGAGAVVVLRTLTTLFESTVSYSVGSGGAGGAARTVDNTDGAAGSAGAGTTFSSWTAAGGLGGAGGTSTGGAAGAARTNATLIGYELFNSLAGGAGGASGAATAAPNSENYLPTGGGGGGGVTSGGVLTAAAVGGGVGNSIIRLRAGASGAGESIQLHGTGGGGGEADLVDGFGGAGWAGGNYGGGGGGGGGVQNGTGSSGAGGVGADGIIIVVVHL